MARDTETSAARAAPDLGPPAIRHDTEFQRTQLDEHSWVDVARGWLSPSQPVFEAVRQGTPWRQGRLWRYEKWVDEPRLGAGFPRGTSPHPVLLEAQRALQDRYGVRFDGFGVALYRDGRDGQAFHRDRDMRWLDDTIIALLTLGARRPWLLRPTSSRYDHGSEDGGALYDLRPGPGDLMVMGGACQVGWEHSVAKSRAPVGERISVQWRWTSGTGRPVIGAGYRAPRNFSR